jgi:alkylation response protein AidB-like acyl-CoA dehydrogenase
MTASPVVQVAKELARGFASREAADAESFPAVNIAEIKEARLHAAPFTVSEGGLGASLSDAVQAIEQVAMASGSTALLLSMPLGLAGVYATECALPEPLAASWREQRARVAEEYRRGRWFAACNSEKGAGGSLAATQTVAKRAADGTFRLNGEKILASGGRYADVFFSTGKVDPADLPGAGIVEFFFVETTAPGVEILEDWDGFGMRSTESQTVRYRDAAASAMMGFPDFIAKVQPLQYFYCLFAGVSLGCAAAMLKALGTPAPQSPALRLRFSEALMRYEALRAYLLETAGSWRAAAGPAYAARVLRTKTYVTQESARLCADLMALSGGRSYRRTSALARALTDVFAGTALRPPLALALDMLMEQFTVEDADGV